MAEPGIHRIEVTTLGDLLGLRAAEHGEHLALVFPDHQVSYAGWPPAPTSSPGA